MHILYVYQKKKKKHVFNLVINERNLDCPSKSFRKKIIIIINGFT